MKTKPVILVVDDQPQNIELLEAHLEPQGYELVQATSGEEALKKLSQEQIDLVLLDVKMPGMSGFEVLAKLRADNKAQHIPVIMITAHRENENRVKALEAGCDDFISKPFDKHELLARVRSLLRIKFLKDDVDESREFAESVINTVREPLIALDQDLRVVTASRCFYEVFQVTSQETVGRLIYDLGNKQWDIPKLRDLLETILPQKTTFDNYEVEHDFAAIGRRVMLLNARQIKRGQGKERIILLAIEDITERKRLEDLLTESEERYRRLFETASDGIVLLEKSEGHIAHANPAAEKMMGYSEKECVGKSLQDIGISIAMSDFPAIMQALKRSGILNYDEVPVKTKSGQTIFADIYMVDRATLAQCNIRDITKRKRDEDALRENMAKLDLVLRSAGMGVWRWEVIENKRYFDGQTCHLLGLDPATFTGSEEEFYGVVHPDDRVRLKAALARTLEEGVLYEPEYRVIWPDKSVHNIMSRGRLVGDDKGKAIRINGIIWDITERKHLEAQLLHSQKMDAVGTLAGGIAHDFNNILNVIMGYGAMVMDNLEPGNPAKEHMGEVLLAADRAAELTKRLLVFSRKQVIELKPVNINEVVLSLQKMLVRVIKENIELRVELADRPLIVLADVGQIEQVLINLAANARDAMEAGGSLTISTELKELDDEYIAAYGYGKTGKYALITVADTGLGMDGETQRKIFEPFFTTKGVGEGTGLGLAISYGIIKKHEGYIKVYSEVGQGTLFKIYLPLTGEPAALEKPAAGAVPVKGGHETLLVAEDDASMRLLIRIVLESFGYSVIAAVDGEDAAVKFMEHRERISLVMLDMIMPKKNGKETGEAIRKISPGMKILFASGYGLDAVKNKELTEAGDAFIRKPFQPKELLLKVRELLDRRG